MVYLCDILLILMENKGMEKVKISVDQAYQMIEAIKYSNYLIGGNRANESETIENWRKEGYVEMSELEKARIDYYTPMIASRKETVLYIKSLENEIERLKKCTMTTTAEDEIVFNRIPHVRISGV